MCSTVRIVIISLLLGVGGMAQTRVLNQSATAQLTQTDGCTETQVEVAVAVGQTRPQPTRGVWVDVLVRDVCQDIGIARWTGHGIPLSNQLAFATTTTTAQVRAPVVVYETATSGLSTMLVEATWQALPSQLGGPKKCARTMLARCTLRVTGAGVSVAGTADQAELTSAYLAVVP